MAIRKITVPKTPKGAYNPGRPVSGLLKAQIAMLESANLSHDAAAGIRTKRPRTEGEAARYIQSLHAALRGHLERAVTVHAGLTPDEKRAALAPRTTSTSDGAKRWPATAGPSASPQLRPVQAPPKRTTTKARAASAKGKAR